MANLASLESAINLFYKSQSSDQAKLNEYLVEQQRSQLGEFEGFSVIIPYYFHHFTAYSTEAIIYNKPIWRTDRIFKLS